VGVCCGGCIGHRSLQFASLELELQSLELIS
jgi:hypothetical protein